jgi:hypothetical protein
MWKNINLLPSVTNIHVLPEDMSNNVNSKDSACIVIMWHKS